MNKITSLCNTCYKHIPGTLTEVDNKIILHKTCEEHGAMSDVVENSASFYHSLKKTSIPNIWNHVNIEVTDRCNLNCPHCYQLPDNRSTDKPIKNVLNEIKQFSKFCSEVILAGAEPTLRKDLPELLLSIRLLGYTPILLTNGVKLHDEDFVQSLLDSGCGGVDIGLNHPEYQGAKVHEKQIKGIVNCVKLGLPIKYIGYTIENYEQLDFIMDQIQVLGKITHHIRIRCGSRIGRAPDEPKRTLSDNYEKFLEYANKHNLTVEPAEDDIRDDNIYHIMLKVSNGENSFIVRLIQWCDVENIVMEELATGPWAKFTDGPVTNFLHQIILRDAFVNNKLPQLDMCPDEFTYKYKIPGYEELHKYVHPDEFKHLTIISS